jgi:hypothetical protein
MVQAQPNPIAPAPSSFAESRERTAELHLRRYDFAETMAPAKS